MFQVTAFTPIITPRQVATPATVRPVERRWVQDGTPVASSMMAVTLSADHSAVDGADAARWLETFKMLVETPQPLRPESLQTKEAMR